jgi:hypothetical protein
MLKLLTSFTGSDHYELLNSILTSMKHGPKYFINPDSEEVNKAIIIIISRAIVLTSFDLHPLDNKDKDETLKNLLREIIKTTPLYFPDHVINCFPKVLYEFFAVEQQQLKNERIYVDSSNKHYKMLLKKKIDEDYMKFLDIRSDNQNQLSFNSAQGSQAPINTLICMLFKLILDETVQQQNVKNYLSFIFV